MPERDLDEALARVADAGRGVSEMHAMPGPVSALTHGVGLVSSGVAAVEAVQVPNEVLATLEMVVNSVHAFVKFVDGISEVSDVSNILSESC